MASLIRKLIPHYFDNVIIIVQIVGVFALIYGFFVGGFELINWIFKFHTPFVHVLVYTGVSLVLIAITAWLFVKFATMDSELDYSGGYY